MDSWQRVFFIAFAIFVPVASYLALDLSGVKYNEFEDPLLYMLLEICVASAALACVLIGIRAYGVTGYKPLLYIIFGGITWAGFILASLRAPPDSNVAQWLYANGCLAASLMFFAGSVIHVQVRPDKEEFRRVTQLFFILLVVIIACVAFADRFPELVPKMIEFEGGTVFYATGTLVYGILFGMVLALTAFSYLRYIDFDNPVIFFAGIGGIFFAAATSFLPFAGFCWSSLFWMERIFSLLGAIAVFNGFVSVYFKR